MQQRALSASSRRRTIARMLAAGLLATAATMLWRQRHEARLVATGSLPKASASAEVASRHRHGPVAQRAASWQPSRPEGSGTRLAAGLWSAPLTTLGYAVALLAGRRPVWDPQRGCFLATGVSGASKIIHRFVGADANTVGQVILCSSSHPSPTLLDHELAHVRQAERLGVLMAPVYLWWGARYGYRDHPLEIAARRFARAQSSPGA